MEPFRHVLDFLRPLAARLTEAAGRLLYPPHCAACARPTAQDEDRHLCRRCIDDIAFVADPTCRKCGHELGEHADRIRRCVNCRSTPLRFDRSVAAAHHTGAARAMVLGLKFAARRQNAYPLGKLLAARLVDVGVAAEAQLMVPVPLHKSRLRARGFNQSALLAAELGSLLDLPVSPGCLRRVVNTPPQTQEMSPASRRANVKGAFAVTNPRLVAGKCVLVVDDVLTTGATASECAGVLKRAGAKRVLVATVTRRMMTPSLPAADPRFDLPASLREEEAAPFR